MFESMHETGAHSIRIPNQRHFTNSRDQLLKKDPHLESRQDQTKTLMRTCAERQMPIRLAFNIKLEGVVENILVKAG